MIRFATLNGSRTFQGCEIAIETLFANPFATLIATIENHPGLQILGPSGCDSRLQIATLIATLVETFAPERFRVANRVAIRVAIRNPESQPEGPKIRNPGGFSMVAIRVANRVANRVSIAISQP